MGRSPCCDKVGLKKGPWTPEEDQKLLAYIQEHGHGSWRALPPKAGLERCGKSCRLRWTNYLRPDIKRGKFSLQEEQTIIQLHALLGNRWSAIASHLAKRTDNEIKNYWNTHLKKRLVKMGIDPTTHKPKNHTLGSSQPKDTANLSHMAQWESARLEAEARIVRESKQVSSTTYTNQLMNVAAATAAATSSAAPRQLPCLDILRVWQGTWAMNNNNNNSSTKMKDMIATSGCLLESPTSILNFSDNTNTINAAVPNVVALINDVNSTFATGSTGNYVGNEGKGIMGNSVMQLHDHVTTEDPHDTSTYSNLGGDSLRFPSFLDGYAVENTSNAVLFEDNKINYWSNILNVVNSPMGSTVF